jgi:uncharacterized protein YukE
MSPTPETLYADETMIDIANSLYALSSEIADIKAKLEQAYYRLDDGFTNSMADNRLADVYALLSARLEALSEAYAKLSDYVWLALSTMLEADSSLASRIYQRMLGSFGIE